MQKEIPILFSTPMVQAILDGRKTMTRRLLDPQPWYGSQVPGGPHFIYPPGSGQRFNAVGSKNGNWYVMDESFQPIFSKMAKWQPGDILWVRESFRISNWVADDGEICFRYEADGAVSPYLYVDTIKSDGEKFVKYWEQSCDDLSKAGYQPNDDERYEDFDYKALRLRPNIFMPKEAARIWLHVTDVRVERLHDITEEDAIAEGVEQNRDGSWHDYLEPESLCQDTAKASFKSLWMKINGAESLEANPWVWVVSFNVLSTTGKPSLQTEKNKA